MRQRRNAQASILYVLKLYTFSPDEQECSNWDERTHALAAIKHCLKLCMVEKTVKNQLVEVFS